MNKKLNYIKWMTQNLRVTKFNNGNSIPKGTSFTDWDNSVDGISGSTIGPLRVSYNFDDYYVYPPYKEIPLPKVTIDLRSNTLGEWAVGSVVLQEYSGGTWSNIETVSGINAEMPITVTFDTLTHTNKRIILSNISIKDSQFGTPEPPLTIDWSIDQVTYYSNDTFPNEFFPNKTIYFSFNRSIK